jgi:hypothetical protein
LIVLVLALAIVSVINFVVGMWIAGIICAVMAVVCLVDMWIQYEEDMFW